MGSLPLEFAGRWHSHISLFLNDPNYITKFLEILTPLKNQCRRKNENNNCSNNGVVLY